MTRKEPTDSKYTSLPPPTTGNRGVEEDQRYTSMPPTTLDALASPPVYSNQFQEARELKEAFRQEFWKEPWSAYIKGTGISRVRRQDPTATSNLEDFCLAVTLKEALPNDLYLPTEYSANGKTIKVYSKVVGEIRSLKDPRDV